MHQNKKISSIRNVVLTLDLTERHVLNGQFSHHTAPSDNAAKGTKLNKNCSLIHCALFEVNIKLANHGNGQSYIG